MKPWMKPWITNSFVSGLLVSALSSSAAFAVDASASPIAEMRRAFTIDGKPVPPEIFRDFGDGDLADSDEIWVSIDVKAAIGSNLYFDDIKQEGPHCFGQAKAPANGLAAESTDYCYFGATANGLLVVLASWSGGGTGVFRNLHILDVAPARAFDSQGKLYTRINLINLRTIALGDRWGGEIKIEKNTIKVVTTSKGPADDSGKSTTATFVAVRP